jgi:glycosyltransferase involved in cell wall biosynthesis
VTEPQLSVVVASVNGFPFVDRCLASLRDHAPDAEVIVAAFADQETAEQIRERWPEVRLLTFQEPTPVPKLRAAGIVAAGAPYVAVIEDHCVVHDGWAERIVAAHRKGHAVVGGSIRNGADGRIRDWAAFFCEYSEHMKPLETGVAPSLPGMNVSYDRRAIEAMAPLLDWGCYETWLHPHLQRSGFELYADDSITLDHDMKLDVGVFLPQRYHHARSYAGMRNAELGRKRFLYLLGSPAVVPLAFSRIVRNVLRRRLRARMAMASPLVLLYTAAWTVGEAAGYALGGGRSLLRVR